jgi:hypothetical protein
MATEFSRSSKSNTRTIAKLQSAILACAEAIERLENEANIHVRRMAVMQSEIDQLRASQQR